MCCGCLLTQSQQGIFSHGMSATVTTFLMCCGHLLTQCQHGKFYLTGCLHVVIMVDAFNLVGPWSFDRSLAPALLYGWFGMSAWLHGDFPTGESFTVVSKLLHHLYHFFWL